MARDRKKAEELGNLGETLGVWFLMLKGYTIISRQYRTPVGEVDIIARKGSALVFIEVKARVDADTAAHAISPRQQSRIVRAADAFLQNSANLGHLDIRFDALLIIPYRWPVHIVDAWRPGD